MNNPCFEWFSPTRVFFGVGESAKINKLVASYKSPLVVGTSRRFCGILNFDFTFKNVSSNPRIQEVSFINSSCDVVIGLGGGSAIDAAKYIGYKKQIPVIAVPTTAGSGAEVTRGAILTDMKKKIKFAVRDDGLFPMIAVCDPELTVSMPSKLTAISGLDALFHAVESFASKKSTKFSRVISKQIANLVFDNLEKVIAQPSNIEERSNMMLAALLGGFNLANVGTCLPHRLQYSLGGLTDTAHAEGVAVLFPAWIKENPEIDIFFSRNIADFIKKFPVPKNLGDFGILEKDIPLLVNNVSGSLDNDPCYKDRETIKRIYNNSL